jgi:lipopolysaccharide exporter
MVSHFLRGLVSTGFGKVTVIILGFLGLMIATRILPPEDMGAFVLIQVISLFLMELSSLGLNMAIPKFLTQLDDKPSERRRLVNTIIYFRLFTTLIACVFAVIAAEPLSRLFNSSMRSELLMFPAVLIALESVGKLLTNLWQADFKFRLIGVVSIVSSVVNFAAIVVCVFILQQGLWGLLYAKILSRVIAFTYGLLRTRLELRLEFDWPTLRTMLIFSFPLQISYILSFIYQRIDTILIALLLGPAQAGLYEIARKIPDSLLDGYDAFFQVYFPHASKLWAENNLKGVSTMLNTSNRWMTCIIIFGTLIAFLFGNEIITTMFSDSYQASGLTFGLLMFALALIVVDSTLGFLLIVIGDSDKPPLINTLRTILGFIGYFIFLPTMGMVGAAIVSILMIALVNPLVIYFLRRRHIDVDVMAYLKPIFLLFAFLAIWQIGGLTQVWERIVLIVLFIPVGLLFSVIPSDEISFVVKGIKPFLSKYVRSAGQA